jgi:uncharacterized protein (TIGR02679 family)
VRDLPDRLAAPELRGLWQRARRAMAAAGDGWPAVRISVPLGDDDQRRAIGGLLARVVRPGTAAIGVALGELDTRVRRPGDGWDLRAVVEAVGGPLPDRRGDTARRAAAVERALAEARAAGPSDPWFGLWLDTVATDGTIARLVGRGDDTALRQAAVILANLPLDGEPLPAVAARLTDTGDTKALSGGPLPGLVLGGVAASLGESRPRTAADRRALWEAVGVVPDDLASQVLVLNMPVRPAVGGVGSGLAAWLADAAQAGEPMRITLHQLVRWQIEPVGDSPVFVCENPAVLRSAAARLGPGAAPLICTEGRPSVAAARLLDCLEATGSPLRVRADYDWPGLRIAGTLLVRPHARPWRFSTADYEAAIHARAGRAAAPLRGAAAASPWDPRLSTAMVEAGEVVYEEELIDTLVSDLMRPADDSARHR